MLVPKAMATAQLQALYLKNDPEMAIRIGPIDANRNRELTAVGVSKSDFNPRFNLVAPFNPELEKSQFLKCVTPLSSSMQSGRPSHIKGFSDKYFKA